MPNRPSTSVPDKPLDPTQEYAESTEGKLDHSMPGSPSQPSQPPAADKKHPDAPQISIGKG